MTSVRVRNWPAFLLRDVPDDLRAQLSHDAQQQQFSIQDIVRGILCDHYKLFCPPRSTRASDLDQQSGTMLLRFQPDLFDALKMDARGTGRSMRTIILETLETHYRQEQP